MAAHLAYLVALRGCGTVVVWGDAIGFTGDIGANA
jgi:hypothetical protein